MEAGRCRGCALYTVKMSHRRRTARFTARREHIRMGSPALAVSGTPSPLGEEILERLAATPLTTMGAAECFADASPEQVRERLEMLTGAGEVWVDGEGRCNRVEQPVWELAT